MRACRFAGGCYREATTTVRMAGVGIRDLCAVHLAWITSAGMDFSVVEPAAFIPEWRKRSLAKIFSTGRDVA